MNFQCNNKNCSGNVIYNTDIVLLSYPAQYRGYCDVCNKSYLITQPDYELKMNEKPKYTYTPDPLTQDYRLYSVNNMYLNGIHNGIQTQHSTVELIRKYSGKCQEEYINLWADNHKTTIILQGGDHYALSELLSLLAHSDYPFAYFCEPGLNNTYTSVSFILSETEYTTIKDEFRNYMYQENYPENHAVLEYISKLPLAK